MPKASVLEDILVGTLATGVNVSNIDVSERRYCQDHFGTPDHKIRNARAHHADCNTRGAQRSSGGLHPRAHFSSVCGRRCQLGSSPACCYLPPARLSSLGWRELASCSSLEFSPSCHPLSLCASLTSKFRLCCRLIIQTGTVAPAAQREELGLDKPVAAVYPEEDQAIPDSDEKEKEH
jgi:hypothetical protein